MRTLSILGSAIDKHLWLDTHLLTFHTEAVLLLSASHTNTRAADVKLPLLGQVRQHTLASESCRASPCYCTPTGGVECWTFFGPTLALRTDSLPLQVKAPHRCSSMLCCEQYMLSCAVRLQRSHFNRAVLSHLFLPSAAMSTPCHISTTR